MSTALLIAGLIVANATPASTTLPAASTVPSLAPDWTALSPILSGEEQHYTRKIGRDPSENLIVSTRRCHCEPPFLVDILAGAFRDTPSAAIARGTAEACGTTVEHLVITNVTDGALKKNIDLYAYKAGDALVTIVYAFTKAAPTGDDERSMAAVCPRPKVGR